MPPASERAKPRHSFMGLFHRNDFRSSSVLRDLEANLADSQFFIIWDRYEVRAADDLGRAPHLHAVAREQLFDFVSERYGIGRDTLASDCRAFPLLLRILLALYLRRVVGLDYCIMTDNDIFLFEPIPEIAALSAARTPFLIQETGAADTLPQISDFITGPLGQTIRYVRPNKGRGYNAGFCGLDLSVFDAFDPRRLTLLLDTLRPMNQWWREQAFFVSLTFTSAKPVHTFQHDRYLFLPYDAPTYRQESKIYHCIFSTDKRQVDLYYLQRYGYSVPQRLRAVVISWLLLVQRLRKRLQIRTRVYRWLGLSRPMAD